MFAKDIDDARRRWLDELVFENLFEEEVLAGLSGFGHQNSSPVTEGDHDCEWIVILFGFVLAKMLRVSLVPVT